MLKLPLKWRRNFDYVGLRGQTEPNHCVGSSALYGTGAEIVPIDDWQRKNCYGDDPPRLPTSEEKYTCIAWFKRGNLTVGSETNKFARTLDEGKAICEAWLRARL